MNEWRETLQFSDYYPLWLLNLTFEGLDFTLSPPFFVGCCVHIHPEYDISAPMSQAGLSALKLDKQLSYLDWWSIRAMSIQPITVTYGHVNIALLNIFANPSQYIPLTTCITPSRSASPVACLNFFENKYRMSGIGSESSGFHAA